MTTSKWLAFTLAAVAAAASAGAAAQADPNTSGQLNDSMRDAPLPTRPANTSLTRAQVRADLARARSDGSIPRFGNPDPYGPAGTPNRNRQ